MLTSFLKQASPFAPLEAAHLRRLAAHLKPHAVCAGRVIVQQGQPGYACFLLRAGHVEVVQQEGGVERHLTTLGPGALFGEVALLSAGPRTATVRALEPCDLLVLHRPDLLKVIGVDPHVDAQLSGTVGWGDRPGQGAAVLGSALLARAMGWCRRRKERA